ncbi:MAG: pantetheine-phosphate adenylyltransferase [Firmicutes bacterium]|nr:pantetheine-phosphate adenylyltransferase [Bacillota bacterium]
MKIAVYPGSFDPVTNGHLDIIERGAELFDKLIVAVAKNPGKEPLFTLEERILMLERSLSHLSNVEVSCFRGLLVDFARVRRATAILRGLRALSDFEYEFQMASVNKKIGDVETIFMMTSNEYAYLSSSAVKEVASLGGCVKGFVPRHVVEMLIKKYEQEKTDFPE